MSVSPFDIAYAMYTKEELLEVENPCTMNWMVARVLSMAPEGMRAAQAMNVCGMDRNPEIAYGLGRYLLPKGRPPRTQYIKKEAEKMTPKQKAETKALSKILLCNTPLAVEALAILEREGVSVSEVLGAKLQKE